MDEFKGRFVDQITKIGANILPTLKVILIQMRKLMT